MTDRTSEPEPIDAMPLETLQAVVEIQRTELNRLLREQTRLNDRIDSLIQLHEREQVLRQQMQASLERLTAIQSDPSRSAAMLPHDATPGASDLHARLARTEKRFSALQNAVGDLISYIERKDPSAARSNADDGFVRVFAPT